MRTTERIRTLDRLALATLVVALASPIFAAPVVPSGGSAPGLIFESGVPASSGATATMPLFFEQADALPEDAIASFTSCVDYDPLDLTFDPTDGDGDGLSDAIRLFVGPGVTATLLHDPEREDCELLLSVVSPEPIPEIQIAEIDFQVAAAPSAATIPVGCGGILSFNDLGGDFVSGFCSPGSFEVQGSEACQVTLTLAGGAGAAGSSGNPVPVLVSANADVRSIAFTIDSSSGAIALGGCESAVEGFVCSVGATDVLFDASDDSVIPAGPRVALFQLLYDVASDATAGEVTLTPSNTVVIGTDAEPCRVVAVGGTFLVEGCDDDGDCADEIACTIDRCEDDQCVHEADDASCEDGVACTVDTCDPMLGACAHAAEDSLCDNGSFCDGVEVCVEQTGCAPGEPADCDDADICTDDSCSERASACQNVFDEDNAPTCAPSGTMPGVIFESGVSATSGAIATLPFFFEQADTLPEDAISSFTSCVDYDPLDLTFDPTDGDGDTLPDATRFFVGRGVTVTVVHDLEREDCELLLSIVSPNPIPEIQIGEIDFEVAAAPSATTLPVGCGDPAGLSFNDLGGDPVSGFCSPGSFEIQESEACQVTLTVAGGAGAAGSTGNPVPVLVSANSDLRSIAFAIDPSSSAIALGGCESAVEGFVCSVGATDVLFDASDDSVIPAGPRVALFQLLYDVASDATAGEVTLTPSNTVVVGTDAEPCRVVAVGGTFLVEACDDDGDCADEIACTIDRCEDDQCVHEADDASCEDGVACTVDTCDPMLGACAHAAEDSLCDNGSFCDGVEVCVEQTGCAPGEPADCDDADICTDDSCSERASACQNVFDEDNAPTCAPSSTSPLISIAVAQFGFGMTLRPGDPLSIAEGGAGIDLPFGSFLPWTADLDALDVVAPGRLEFSVGNLIGVTHTGGFLALKPERVYAFDRDTGVITTAVNWNDWGIPLRSLDALDRLEDGRLLFSSRVLQGVQHAGGYIVLRPANVYRFDPEEGTIELYLNGMALGFGTIDALDVGDDGRIALSFELNQLVTTQNGSVSTRHANVYRFDPETESLTLAFDGEALGIATLDAFSGSGTSSRAPDEISGGEPAAPNTPPRSGGYRKSKPAASP